MRRTLTALVAVTLAFGLPVALGAETRPDSFATLAERLKPSVVNISTTKVVQRAPRGTPAPSPFGQRDPFRDFFGDEFFDRFFGDQGQPPREFKGQSLGSGFILDAQGHILTNNHVVDGADEVLVRLSDEHEFQAKVVGTDPKTDIALIRIEPKGVRLQPVTLGNSDALRVGDWVLAVGNPFGYSHTVTAGIISAKGRVIGAGPYDDFLQTDAAINPGNSGGPLFDLQGRVVGINTAIVARGTGIGFAIPVNMAGDIVAQLKKRGKVTRGWLGVLIQDVTKELAKSFGLDATKGALVSEVVKDSPAEKAGLERGDVILEFGGIAIDKRNDLPRLVADRGPGAKADLLVLRKGKKKTLTVTLGELKDEALAGRARVEERMGLTVQAITPEMRRHLELVGPGGLLVSGVEPGSAAAEAGVRRGDVILEVNQREVPDLDAYQSALRDLGDQESVLLLVRRGQGTLFLVIPLSK